MPTQHTTSEHAGNDRQIDLGGQGAGRSAGAASHLEGRPADPRRPVHPDGRKKVRRGSKDQREVRRSGGGDHREWVSRAPMRLPKAAMAPATSDPPAVAGVDLAGAARDSSARILATAAQPVDRPRRVGDPGNRAEACRRSARSRRSPWVIAAARRSHAHPAAVGRRRPHSRCQLVVVVQSA
jgi:hypothetical protein